MKYSPTTLGDRIDRLAKASAVVAVCLYLIGFAVVSFHDATYGFVAFNPFRAKILAAGLTFAALYAVALLRGAQEGGGFGFTVPVDLGSDKPLGFIATRLYRLSRLGLSAWTLSFFFRFIVVDDPFRWSHTGLYLGYVAAKSIPEVSPNSRLRQHHPYLLALLALVPDVVGLALVVYMKWFIFGAFVLWFFLASFDADTISNLFEGKVDAKRFEWHFLIFSALSLFFLFGGAIYPSLPPMLGGGHLTPISFQFLGGASIDRSLESNDLLVDEVEGGYYIVRSKDNETSVFIPRSVVSLTFYGSERNPFEGSPKAK